MVKYRHPIHTLDNIIDELCGPSIFSKIDLRYGYHRIHMKPSDEWKMIFQTKFRLYKWLVIPFRLTNFLRNFMKFLNHVLKPFINKFVVVYFDEILVYSNTIEGHVANLK